MQVGLAWFMSSCMTLTCINQKEACGAENCEIRLFSMASCKCLCFQGQPFGIRINQTCLVDNVLNVVRHLAMESPRFGTQLSAAVLKSKINITVKTYKLSVVFRPVRCDLVVHTHVGTRAYEREKAILRGQMASVRFISIICFNR